MKGFFLFAFVPIKRCGAAGYAKPIEIEMIRRDSSIQAQF